MLTFELNVEHNVLEIFFDEEGKQELLKVLSRITKRGDHEHLATPAWAGQELSSTLHSEKNILVNMVTIGIPRD